MAAKILNRLWGEGEWGERVAVGWECEEGSGRVRGGSGRVRRGVGG